MIHLRDSGLARRTNPAACVLPSTPVSYHRPARDVVPILSDTVGQGGWSYTLPRRRSREKQISGLSRLAGDSFLAQLFFLQVGERVLRGGAKYIAQFQVFGGQRFAAAASEGTRASPWCVGRREGTQ